MKMGESIASELKSFVAKEQVSTYRIGENIATHISEC